MEGERAGDDRRRWIPAAIGIAAAALCLFPIGNNDIWWHLAAGRQTLADGAIPRADVFSFTRAGAPWVSHEWLASVAFWLVHRAAGIGGLIAFRIAAAVAAVAIALAAVPRTSGARLVAAVLAPIALWLCAPRFLVRPELFTLVFVAIGGGLAIRARDGAPRAALALPLVLAAWVQLHGAFILGLGLAALLAGAEGWRALRLRDRRALARAAWILVGSFAATLANPHGPAILAFPFRLAGSAVFAREILEWRSPFAPEFRSTTIFPALLAWLVLAAVAAVILARRRRIVPALWVAALAVLAIRMSRNTAVLAIGSWPPIAAAFGPAAERLGSAPRRRIATAAGALALAIGIVAITAGFPYRPGSFRAPGFGIAPTIPVRMADVMAARGFLGKALDTYAFGGYLTFRLYPRVLVAMDSRNEVYGEDFYVAYREAFRTDTPLRRRLLDEADVACLDAPENDGSGDLHDALAASDVWALVYFDDRAFLYAREDGPPADRVREDAFRRLRPDRLEPRAGSIEEWKEAVAEARRARAASNDALRARILEGYAWAGLAVALDEAGHAEEARAALLRAGESLDGLAFEPGIPWQVPFQAGEIHRLLGEGSRSAAHREAAIERYRRALAIDPNAKPARDALRALGEALR
ncbi:MAG: hypothetical protein JXP34_10020 [Planctomycetes bacterium]|nr:hypothetical protein [Planctomycetota bacterium]